MNDAQRQFLLKSTFDALVGRRPYRAIPFPVKGLTTVQILKAAAVKYALPVAGIISAYYIYKKRMAFRGWLARRLGRRTKRYGGTKYRKTKGVSTKAIKRVINRSLETKFIQVSYTALFSALTTTMSAPLLLNPLLRGNTDNSRIGDRVRAIKLHISYQFYSAATTNVCPTFRLTVVRIKQPRGVAPLTNGSDVYDTTNPAPLDMINYDLDWNKRYEFLHVERHTLKPAFAAQTLSHYGDIHVNLSDMIMDYSLGNAGTIADIDTNALYLYCQYDNSATAGSIYGSYHLTYKDM